jgi:hypothetical protein
MTTTPYKQTFLAIKYDYDTKCSMTEERLNEYIRALDAKTKIYQVSKSDSRPSYCFSNSGNIKGQPSSDGSIQIFSEQECASFPNSIRSANGECTASTGGSYSWNCRQSAGSGGSNMAALEKHLTESFQPIGQYYSNLQSIKKRLNEFLEETSDQVVDLKDTMINKERYDNRAHPEYAVKPRELVYGLFSELRPSSVPIVLAASVFMACISILMIFQMFGFTGQINLPPALTATGSPSSGSSGGVPLYMNPMVLSGVSLLLGTAVIVLGVMYYRAKQK